MCTPYIESQKWLSWQHPLEPRNRLCPHPIAWPRKPTPRIKQRVASYHTTEVIAHRKAKRGCHANVPWVQGIGNICILSTTTQTPFISNCLVTIVHTKPVNSDFSPKIGCHGNDPLTLNIGYVFIGELDPENPPLESNCVSLAIIQPKS